MTARRFHELRGLYIDGHKDMSTEDLREFLILVEKYDDDFRETRVETISNELRMRKRRESARKARERENKRLALEYKELTEKWEELGAYFENTESLTVWKYRGEEFFRWWSRTSLESLVNDAKKGDEKLKELID